jgi:cyclopropane-fatty-acyl-phospholipid synthase
MGLISLEHGSLAYRADLAFYALAVLALGGLIAWLAPADQHLAMALWLAAGLTGWSGLEYVLHRFVLHGLAPFSRWHSAHHARPRALICTPTLMSAALIAGLVALPAGLLLGRWPAGAFTLGVLAGYLAYSIAHHATHHWRADHPWLHERKRWHALHHRPIAQPGCYGVTSSFWDHACGTAGGPRSCHPPPHS